MKSEANGPSASPRLTGVFWIPVGQQLSQFALFNLSYLEVIDNGESIRINYELPQELTGAVNKIEFEGPKVKRGPLLMSGVQGRIECSDPNDFSNCLVYYRDLNFDGTARTALLQSLSSNDEDLRKRELVAARFQFGGQPYGFLRILSPKQN